jgi:Tfp pilus assembly protein PilO
MNTVQLIIAVTGFISLLAAVTAGAWLNQRAIEKQMEAFRNEMKAEFAAMRVEMRVEIQSVNNHVTSVESRVERIERQLEAIFKPVLPGKGD